MSHETPPAGSPNIVFHPSPFILLNARQRERSMVSTKLAQITGRVKRVHIPSRRPTYTPCARATFARIHPTGIILKPSNKAALINIPCLSIRFIFLPQIGVCDASCEMHRLHDVLQFFETLLKNRIVKN